MTGDTVHISAKRDEGSGDGRTLESGSSGKEEGRRKKDVPLEKMTKAQLREKIGELEGTVMKNYDLYLRSHAEMENMKRRFQKEKQDLAKFANESLVKQLLPVVDSLEQALCHSEEDPAACGLTEGVSLTLKGLMDTLKKTGVEPVNALGEPFDPNFHEAVSEIEDDTVEARTVVQELQKGYLLNQRLIRPSMVVVSRRSARAAACHEGQKFQA